MIFDELENNTVCYLQCYVCTVQAALTARPWGNPAVLKTGIGFQGIGDNCSVCYDCRVSRRGRVYPRRGAVLTVRGASTAQLRGLARYVCSPSLIVCAVRSPL